MGFLFTISYNTLIYSILGYLFYSKLCNLYRQRMYFRKNMDVTPVPIITARQKVMAKFAKNLPVSTVMLDGKFLASKYKTETMTVGSMNEITQIVFAMMPSINSNGNPQIEKAALDPLLQNIY